MQGVMRKTASLAVLATALTATSASAIAADLPVYSKAPAVEAWNPWMIRVRAVGVFADGNSTVHVVNDPTLDSPRSGLSFSDQVMPELDVSYFFTKNIAAEAILAVPQRTTITGTGQLAGLQIGKTTAIAPILTFQYHVTDLGAFKPYIGLGINYTTSYNTKAANQPAMIGTGHGVLPVSVTSLSIGDSFGAVAQFGFDFMIDRHWGFNFDVKRVWMRPEYTAIDNVAGGALITPAVGSAHVDPWLVGAGVTYKF